MEPTIITRTVKHQFSQEELIEKARELSQLTHDLDEVEGHAKAVSSEIRAKKNNLRRQITETSEQISDGCYYPEVYCEVIFHTPEDGMKTIKRIDTGESWTEKMEEQDNNLFNQPDDGIPM